MIRFAKAAWAGGTAFVVAIGAAAVSSKTGGVPMAAWWVALGGGMTAAGGVFNLPYRSTKP